MGKKEDHGKGRGNEAVPGRQAGRTARQACTRSHRVWASALAMLWGEVGSSGLLQHLALGCHPLPQFCPHLLPTPMWLRSWSAAWLGCARIGVGSMWGQNWGSGWRPRASRMSPLLPTDVPLLGWTVKLA